MPLFKADPALAIDALFENDWSIFREYPWTDFRDAPPRPVKPLPGPGTGGYTSGFASPKMPKMLEVWLQRDTPAALAWTREIVAEPGLEPRFCFLILDRLSTFGHVAEAADLAHTYLPEDLRVIALDRILQRWSRTDAQAAEAWKRALE